MPAVKTPVEAEKPKFKIPKKSGDLADRWFDLMQQRLTLQRQVDALEAEERFLKNHIIDTLPANSATGISGQRVTVMIERKERPEISDYDAFIEYIAKNRKKGTFALLNRAVNAKSVKEYWAAGQTVPGIDKVQYKTLSYSRRNPS